MSFSKLILVTVGGACLMMVPAWAGAVKTGALPTAQKESMSAEKTSTEQEATDEDQAASEETIFFSKMKEIPVMDGLTEAKGQALVFDKPWGRIVQVKASGQVDPDMAFMFYWQTLPTLGWTKNVSGWFYRENEKLLLDVQYDQKTKTSMVTIQVEPR